MDLVEPLMMQLQIWLDIYSLTAFALTCRNVVRHDDGLDLGILPRCGLMPREDCLGNAVGLEGNGGTGRTVMLQLFLDAHLRQERVVIPWTINLKGSLAAGTL